MNEADVERVARAIACAAGWELPNDLSLPHTSSSRVGVTLGQARAAIAAMSPARPSGVAEAITRLRSLVTHADCYGARADQPLSIQARNDLDLMLATFAPVGTRPKGGDAEGGSMRSTSDAVPKAGAQ